MKAAVLQKSIKMGAEAVVALVAGAVGGWLIGFVLLSFGSYIGRSGNSGPGAESFGYWNPQVSWGLAGFYGMPLGLVVFPIGYFLFLRRLSLSRRFLIPAIGTLLGGLLGALAYPPMAALFGVVGFFIASVFAGART